MDTLESVELSDRGEALLAESRDQVEAASAIWPGRWNRGHHDVGLVDASRLGERRRVDVGNLRLIGWRSTGDDRGVNHVTAVVVGGLHRANRIAKGGVLAAGALIVERHKVRG